MVKLHKKRNRKRINLSNLLELNLIKIRVMIKIVLFKKTSIERDDVDDQLINELVNWSSEKGFEFSVKKTEKQIYIVGHHYSEQTKTFRHCTVLFFSK